MANGNRLTMRDLMEHNQRLKENIEDLRDERDRLVESNGELRRRARSAEEVSEAQRDINGQLRDEMNRLKGYQDRVREEQHGECDKAEDSWEGKLYHYERDIL